MVPRMSARGTEGWWDGLSPDDDDGGGDMAEWDSCCWWRRGIWGRLSSSDDGMKAEEWAGEDNVSKYKRGEVAFMMTLG